MKGTAVQRGRQTQMVFNDQKVESKPSKSLEPPEAMHNDDGSVGPSIIRSTWVTLALLTVMHFVVDTFACIVNPLWPHFESHLSVHRNTVLVIYVVSTMTMSISQLAFGYISDKFRSRWLLVCGPIVSVVGMCSIGLTTSPFIFTCLLLSAGLGISAFHPEAAATAGACVPQNRSRAMSVFALAGYLGQAAGPAFSGLLTQNFGITNLAWGIPIGLTAVLLLTFGQQFQTPPSLPLTRQLKPATRSSGSQTFAICIMLAISILRVVGAIGVPLALAYLIDERTEGSMSKVGFAQSIFMGGTGIGAIFCAIFVHRHLERPVLLWAPLLVALGLSTIPLLKDTILTIGIGFTGLFIGFALPVLISYGQQLFPHRQRMASSLTMGVSWGFGSGIVALIIFVIDRQGDIRATFWVFAIASLLSSALSLLLPQVSTDEVDGQPSLSK